jgi:alkanesulfonate monooxygenase SsuD/methylene tetrahydromethanopterin reductase-like flavin-dependent oxidoreductase (luciferase family)
VWDSVHGSRTSRHAAREYHSEHYDFERLKMCPVPSEPIPIYVGGHTDPALRRAAKLADGWCSAGTDVSSLKVLLAKLNGYRRDVGRGDLPFEIQALCPDTSDVDGFRRLRDLGVTDAIVGPWGIYDADPLSISQKQDAVRRFGHEIIAKL